MIRSANRFCEQILRKEKCIIPMEGNAMIQLECAKKRCERALKNVIGIGRISSFPAPQNKPPCGPWACNIPASLLNKPSGSRTRTDSQKVFQQQTEH